MSTRQQRALRGFAAAAFALFVALFAHVIGGGEMPQPLQLLVPLVFATPLSILILGIRRSFLALNIAVGLSQWILHTVFSFQTSPLLAPEAAGHHAHHTLDLGLLAPLGAAPVIDGMWLSHFVAGIVTSYLFWRAERVALAIARLADHLLARLFPLLGAEPVRFAGATSTGHDERPRVGRPRLGQSVRTLRGPPAVRLATTG